MSQDHALNPRAAGLGRRELLSWGLVAASTALTAKLFDVGLRFARPAATAGEFGGQFDLGPVADLPDADTPPPNHPAGRFFLVRTPDGVSALHKVCTRLSCLLTWDDQTKAFACPCHGSQFGRDGELATGPASRGMDQFVVQLVTPNGRVVAETDPQRGGPVTIPGAAQDQESLSGDENAAEASEANDVAAGAGGQENPQAGSTLRVVVDTGRLIPGRSGGMGMQRGS